MNDIDTRINAALHAAADRIDERSLRPAKPPTSRATGRRTVRWLAPSLAAAAVAAVAIVTVVVASGGSGPQGAPIQPGQSGTVVSSPTVSSAPSTPASKTPTPAPRANGSCPFADMGCTADSYYEPLWPFANQTQAKAWEASGGSQPWHLDAKQTALAFVHGYLRFADIDSAATSGTGLDTLVQVGYVGPNGLPHIAAVLHLVRYGHTLDAPWEVVGTNDTDFSLEQPAYGTQISSPVTVGGHITGVDENIVVDIRDQSGASVQVGAHSVPAGSVNAPWTVGAVPFSGSGVLTIIAWTGGHVAEHERFAIQGVHT